MKEICRSSKIKSKILLAMMICLDLVVMLTICTTLAYVFTSSDPVTNTFTPVTSDIEIGEEFEDNVKKNVVVNNTGSLDSYIRAKVVITWQNEAGEVYPEQPVVDTEANGGDYIITYGTADWTLAADGFWYYKASVAPEASTGNLIVNAQPIKKCVDASYTLHIEILSQAVQSTPDSAVDVWDNAKVDVTGHEGTLTVTANQQSE